MRRETIRIVYKHVGRVICGDLDKFREIFGSPWPVQRY